MYIKTDKLTRNLSYLFKDLEAHGFTVQTTSIDDGGAPALDGVQVVVSFGRHYVTSCNVFATKAKKYNPITWQEAKSAIFEKIREMA